MPDDIAAFAWPANGDTVHLPALIAGAFGISTSEARRGLAQGAVRLDGEALSGDALDLPADAIDGRVIQFGKRRFARVAIAMTVSGGLLRLQTPGDGEIVDITEGVARVVAAAEAGRGLVTVFAVGSTAAVTTMEYEPGGVDDLRALLDRLIPAAGDYAHNRLNHDSNSHAHQRASLIGPSETIPVVDGRMMLGTWQQIVLLDFDDRPRERTVSVQVVC